MSPEAGLRYRRMILDWGGSRDEMEGLGLLLGHLVWCDLTLFWGNCLPFALLRGDIKAIHFHLIFFFFLIPFSA